MIDLKSFQDYWNRLLNCCLKHPKDFKIEDVIEVLQWETSGDDGHWTDTNGAAIARIKDGRFAVFCESADSSGHG